MPKLLGTKLDLPRCPHCGVDMPNLGIQAQFILVDFENRQKFWRVYSCDRCAGIVTAMSLNWGEDAFEFHPSKNIDLSDDIPERARTFLREALESIRSPSGAVMLTASAVDAMLKAKNLKTGSLFDRINQAAGQHLITPEMAQWDHDIRLPIVAAAVLEFAEQFLLFRVD